LVVWPLPVLVFRTIRTPFSALAAAENVKSRSVHFRAKGFKRPPMGNAAVVDARSG
jgi:hypothetical protein